MASLRADQFLFTGILLRMLKALSNAGFQFSRSEVLQEQIDLKVLWLLDAQ